MLAILASRHRTKHDEDSIANVRQIGTSRPSIRTRLEGVATLDEKERAGRLRVEPTRPYRIGSELSLVDERLEVENR
jgi:hypothetical protein